MFALAGYLGMTVGELKRRMDSAEFSEWIAYTRYFQALPDSAREAALVTTAVLAPHSPKGRVPRVEDFIPIAEPPQHPDQQRDVILDLKRQLGFE